MTTQDSTFKDILFIAWEDASGDERFLVATEDQDSLAELHERRPVGVYRLEKVIVLANKTTAESDT